MGGFLIVQCGGAARRPGLFDEGLRNYHRLKGQTPVERIEGRGTSVAKFGRLSAATEGIAKDPETESWLISIGTVVVQSRSGGCVEGLLETCLGRGGEIAEELDGFFVLAFYDGRQNELMVITDRVGSCHAYLWSEGDELALASSSWVLGALSDRRLDLTSCYEFLSTGTIFEGRTLFSAVKKLDPATIYRFSNGRLRSKRVYWDFGALPFNTVGGERAIDLLSESLIEAAKQVHQSRQRILCDLTGGYDSRAVVAIELAAKVKFSTIVNGSPSHPDVLTASRIAKVLGLDHHQNDSPPDWAQDLFAVAKEAHRLTDGEYDILEYARTYRNHMLFAEKFDLSLNGSGGEIARGYWWELLFPFTGWSNRIDLRRLAARRFAVVASDPSVFSPAFRFDLVEHFTDVLERLNNGIRHLPNTAQMDHSYLRLRMQRWQGRIASSTNQIWPCLSIFLCRKPLEVSLCTVHSVRSRSLLIRRMLEKINPTLADLPRENGCPALPVRLSNFYRFYPIMWDLGRRVSRRVVRGTGKRGTIGRAASEQGNLLGPLWREEEVRDLLDSSKMKTDLFYDPKGLKGFLQASQCQNFLLVGQFGRILTLERTIRRLGETG